MPPLAKQYIFYINAHHTHTCTHSLFKSNMYNYCDDENIRRCSISNK